MESVELAQLLSLCDISVNCNEKASRSKPYYSFKTLSVTSDGS
jgi:hypothetical protein